MEIFRLDVTKFRRKIFLQLRDFASKRVRFGNR